MFHTGPVKTEHSCNKCGRSFIHETGLRHHTINRQKSGKCGKCASQTVSRILTIFGIATDKSPEECYCFSIYVSRIQRNAQPYSNKAGYKAAEVACRWAGAIFEVTRPFGQELWGQKNKIIKKVKCDQPTDRPTDGQSGL